MGPKKKKKNEGIPFVSGDSRGSIGSPCIDIDAQPRTREPQTAFNNISCESGAVPIGATLRPFDDSNAENIELESGVDTQNWLVDEEKLFFATNDALKAHNIKNRANHIPNLQKHKTRKVGFGMEVSFRCGYKNCQFESKTYKLYQTTNNGLPLPNLQIGIAMTKSDLTPKTVEALATTMNLAPPNIKTLEKCRNQALECTEKLADLAMLENRKEVTSTLKLLGEVQPGEIPSIDVSLDGQYSNRSYHFPSGKSDSVSVPVIEGLTGKGLLIEHVNLAHRDGTLPSSTHINSAETLAARISYEKTHSTPEYPLCFGVVTTDGDTGLAKALEAGRVAVGEKRPLKRRGCIFHGESATKRKFNRESLCKLTPSQKALVVENPDTSQLPMNEVPNKCSACQKQLKSSKGLTIHKRSCKGEKADELRIKGLEPLFLEWEKRDSTLKLSVRDKKIWRDSIRRWVLKRIKLELNVGLHAQNPRSKTIENDQSIHDALYLGGKTVIPCISGDHELCLVDARGCGGKEFPPDYDFLPTKAPLGPIPPQTFLWLCSIVDSLLSREALKSFVIDGKKSTTSLVESVHKEIRGPIPKGRVYRKNEAKLIKSGMSEIEKIIIKENISFSSASVIFQ